MAQSIDFMAVINKNYRSNSALLKYFHNPALNNHHLYTLGAKQVLIQIFTWRCYLTFKTS